MSQAVTKSSISVLGEFCKRKCQPPAVYTFISDESALEFVCTVKCFDETKTGKGKVNHTDITFLIVFDNLNVPSGRSKKKAKHEAAQNLINHLRGLESFKYDLIFLNVSPNSVDETKVSSSTTSEIKRKATVKSVPEINYVGQLLEYCTKSKLPPASFETMESTRNLQNQTEFSIKCTVNNVDKMGTGPTKQQAKRMAAMKVLEEIRLVETSTAKDNFRSEESSPKRLKICDGDESADIPPET